MGKKNEAWNAYLVERRRNRNVGDVAPKEFLKELIATPAPRVVEPTTYEVRSGDNYFNIAQRLYGNQMMAGNLIAENDGRRLTPGMTLRAPVQVSNPIITHAQMAYMRGETPEQYASSYRGAAGQSIPSMATSTTARPGVPTVKPLEVYDPQRVGQGPAVILGSEYAGIPQWQAPKRTQPSVADRINTQDRIAGYNDNNDLQNIMAELPDFLRFLSGESTRDTMRSLPGEPTETISFLSGESTRDTMRALGPQPNAQERFEARLGREPRSPATQVSYSQTAPKQDYTNYLDAINESRQFLQGIKQFTELGYGSPSRLTNNAAQQLETLGLVDANILYMLGYTQNANGDWVLQQQLREEQAGASAMQDAYDGNLSLGSIRAKGKNYLEADLYRYYRSAANRGGGSSRTGRSGYGGYGGSDGGGGSLYPSRASTGLINWRISA